VTDHLGSTTKLINTDGTEYSDMEYLAWGSDRLTPPGIGTSFKYTGQRQAEAGLYYYNARWYDPLTGRFIQADSIIPAPSNPLAWDRYAYGMNSPINYTDPSGHKACEDQGNGTVCTNDRPLEKSSEEIDKRVEQVVGFLNFTRNILRKITNEVNTLAKEYNYAIQTPHGVTLYETPTYPLGTGFRVFGDVEIGLDNNSDITLGPSSSRIGDLTFSPDSTGVVNERGIFGQEIEMLSPSGISIAGQATIWTKSYGSSVLEITPKLGIQVTYRPDTAFAGLIPLNLPGFVYAVITNPWIFQRTVEEFTK
jgi:RHS repeat-associated protein